MPDGLRAGGQRFKEKASARIGLEPLSFVLRVPWEARSRVRGTLFARVMI